MLIIGLDYQHSFTFAHYVEENVGVDYRYIKDFTAAYIDEKGNAAIKTYSMLVRDLDMGVETNLNPMGKRLEENNISTLRKINGVDFYLIDLAASFDEIKINIQDNHGIRLHNIVTDK